MVDYPHGGAASVFRDFAEDGNPVSGPNEPRKDEVRDLLSQYETLITALQAATGDPDAIAEILAAFANKADKATLLTAAGLASGGGDLSTNRTITVTPATPAEANARSRTDVAVTPAALAGAPADSLVRVKGADSYTSRVAYGTSLDAATDIPIGDLLDGLKFSVRSTSTGASLSIKVYEQLNAGRGNVRPGADANDTLIFTLNPTLASLGVTPGGAAANVVVAFGGYVRVRAGYSYGAIVSVLNSSGVAVITGIGTLSGTFAEARRQTWYTDDGVTWSSASGQSIAFSTTRRVTPAEGDGYVGGLAARQTVSEAAIATNTNFLATTSTQALLETRGGTNFTKFSYATFRDAGAPGMAVGSLITDVEWRMRIDTDIATIVTRVWRRPLGSAAISAGPGEATDDVLVSSWTVDRATAGFTVGDTSYRTVKQPLATSFFVETGYTYGFEVLGLKSTGVQGITGLYYFTTTASPTRTGFYYRGAAGGDYAVSTTASLALTLYTSSTVSTRDPAVQALMNRSPSSSGSGSVSAASVLAAKFRGSIGMTGYSGRMEFVFDNSTAKTYRAIFSLAQHADAIRVLFGHGGASPVHVGKFAVAAVAAPTNYACSGVTWVAGTIAGAAAGTIPGRPGALRRGLLASDWIPISTLARSDDATKRPLIAVSAYIDTAIPLTLIGKSDGTSDYTAWASHPTNPRVYRYADGDCVTTPASFTDTTNRSVSPIIGVQYLARGQVITVMGTGDSITNGEGVGITYAGGGMLHKACLLLSTSLSAVAYDYINFGWSGCTTATIRDSVIDAFAAGILPDILVRPNWSPNDISGTIDDVEIARIKTALAPIDQFCDDRGVRRIIWTGLPSNPSTGISPAGVKDYGSSDSKRRDLNDETRARAACGDIIVDWDAIVAGTTVNGQVTMIAGSTSDGIHPDDSGQDDGSVLFQHGIQALGLARTGSLITS